MSGMDDLLAGYQRFRAGTYQDQCETYRALAAAGQSPKVMIIGCCDSRVDPATIFDAGPGELFILRNVANLVPPYETGGGHHGTSAAIEFAVGGLGVEHILVLGHAKCGGIRALAEGAVADAPEASNIARWMSIAGPALEAARGADSGGDIAALAGALEKSAIGLSLENLGGFPMVREAVAAGRLALHGAWFDIESGTLDFVSNGGG